MRRILNQAANAAVKAKGTIFEIVYRRLVSRLGHNQTIGAIALSRVAGGCRRRRIGDASHKEDRIRWLVDDHEDERPVGAERCTPLPSSPHTLRRAPFFFDSLLRSRNNRI
jgi:hypothetical protein